MPSQANNRRGGHKKGWGGRNDNNKIYALPLPLALDQSHNHLRLSSSQYLLGLFTWFYPRLDNPKCEGVFDPTTRSVWICNARDREILWRRGFFGKGNLSRSEPTWYARKAAAGTQMTSEQAREKRRLERKQFKQDRAAALAQAAAEAEAAFREGREAAVTVIPSGATWKPAEVQESGPSFRMPEESHVPFNDKEELETIEHLQLTLQEAFFLAWNLDCLIVLESDTFAPMTIQETWTAFVNANNTGHVQINTLSSPFGHRLDNPFLINYAVYHHFRALGWVVKNGIKFCVDFLLYRRGPVFNHAEFAVVIIPVYEDPTDEANSPFNTRSDQSFSWSWLSTVNRVNSTVQKTLILTYVTIPAQSEAQHQSLLSPACLSNYTVREVVLRRFIPARLRE